MLSGVQPGNGTPHDLYNIRGIAHARTNRKDEIFMQRRLVQNFTFILEWGQGTCSLMKHTWRWTYSRYLFHACCLLRFAAFFILNLKATTTSRFYNVWNLGFQVCGALHICVKVKVELQLGNIFQVADQIYRTMMSLLWYLMILGLVFSGETY